MNKHAGVFCVLVFVVSFSPAAISAQDHLPDEQTRIRVSICSFSNTQGDPNDSHWSVCITGLIWEELKLFKSIRKVTGSSLAKEHLGILDGDAIDSRQGQKIGELLDVDFVIAGSYKRKDDKWHVIADVIDVDDPNGRCEVCAESDNWFELRDILTPRILKYLEIDPTDCEKKKMACRQTSCSEALELFGKGLEAARNGESIDLILAYAEKALTKDDKFVNAYLMLAGCKTSQGQYEEAFEYVQKAMDIDPENPNTLLLMGTIYYYQGKLEQAQKNLISASALDADESSIWSLLGKIANIKKQWRQSLDYYVRAIAGDPLYAEAFAVKGVCYLGLLQRDKAVEQLSRSRELLIENQSSKGTLLIIAGAYGRLGETELAVESFERFFKLAEHNMKPEEKELLEETYRNLKQKLTPSYIDDPEPQILSDCELIASLQQQLTDDEYKLAVNPVASNEGIKLWAVKLTEGKEGQLDKAKAISDRLCRRIHDKSSWKSDPLTRTALEVFGKWNDPNEYFSCQEYAKLYVAMARDVGLKAFMVHVNKLDDGKRVNHACAAIFAEGKALLVDPINRWFGAPYQDYIILDDIGAVAQHLSQSSGKENDLERARAAVKISGGRIYERISLVMSMIFAEQLDSAEEELQKVILQFGKENLNVVLIQGILAYRHGDIESALKYFEKVYAADPEDSGCLFYYGLAMMDKGKLKEARKFFIDCIENAVLPDKVENAAEVLSIIERVTSDQLPEDPDDDTFYSLKGAYFLNKSMGLRAIEEFSKSIRIKPQNNMSYFNRGIAYTSLDKYELAVKDYTKAHELKPDHYGTITNRGLIYLHHLEKYDLAIIDFGRAIKLKPLAKAYSARAEAYVKAGHNELAFADIEKAIQLDPKLVWSYRTRGSLRRVNGDSEGAIRDFNKFQALFKATEQNPPQDPVVFSDPNLKTGIEKDMKISNPTQDDMLRLTRLSIKNSGVKNLDGLEHAANLKSLSLWGNKISDLGPLEGLVELTFLSLGKNKITNIEALHRMIKMQRLYLQTNRIDDLDGLPEAPNLEVLMLCNNIITDIGPITNYRKLKKLHIHINPLIEEYKQTHLPVIMANNPDMTLDKN